MCLSSFSRPQMLKLNSRSVAEAVTPATSGRCLMRSMRVSDFEAISLQVNDSTFSLSKPTSYLIMCLY